MLHCNIVSHWFSRYPEWSLKWQLATTGVVSFSTIWQVAMERCQTIFTQLNSILRWSNCVFEVWSTAKNCQPLGSFVIAVRKLGCIPGSSDVGWEYGCQDVVGNNVDWVFLKWMLVWVRWLPPDRSGACYKPARLKPGWNYTSFDI